LAGKNYRISENPALNFFPKNLVLGKPAGAFRARIPERKNEKK